MDATALTTAKQNIRQFKKQKAELAAATPDRKKTRRLQRKIRLLKRTTHCVLATEKKAVAAKAAAEAAAKETAEKAAAAKAAADAKAAEAKAAADAAKAAEAAEATEASA